MKRGYGKITPAVLAELERELAAAGGRGRLSTTADDLDLASRDETEDLSFPPEAVVFATSTAEVSAVMRVASRHRVPVTPRGAGTGLSGGALPTHGGIALSLVKMDRILEVDSRNLFAVVEPGVITQKLQETVEKAGLFYPPDPASRGSCTIGGNLASCSGGPRALKYGVTKDYVYGLEAVLPSGEIIRTGGKLLKNVTGYNLTQLLVGSEGTLAVITKITLKLIALPRHKRTLMVPFDSPEAAARTVPAVFMAGITPCAMEFMERSVVECASDHIGKPFPNRDAAAQLLIELDGNDEESITRDAERIAEVASENGARDVLAADSSERQAELWAVRRACGEAVKGISPYRELDTVVPRAELPKLFAGVKEICARHGALNYCYGHAGDGNLHVNVLKGSRPDAEWNALIPRLTREIFEHTVSLGGMLSGEHGIGLVQRDYLPIALDADVIRLQKGLKQAFDPDGILNPGKLFPGPGAKP